MLYWTCRLTGFVPAQITGIPRSIVVWEGHGFSRADSVQTYAGFSPFRAIYLRSIAKALKSAMVFEIKYFKYTLFRVEQLGPLGRTREINESSIR